MWTTSNIVTRVVAKPEYAFLGLGLLIGLLFVFLTPPMHVPDEPAHFYRSFQISEGTLIGTKEAGVAGGWLPNSLQLVTYATIQDVPFHPERRIDVARVRKALAIPLEPDKRELLHFPNPVLYFPIIYIPQAIGIALCRIFDSPPLVAFYGGRLFNVLASILITFLAIKIAPIFRWTLFLVALTPIVCFERASLSCDSTIHALSFLFVALVLRMIETQNLDKHRNLLLSHFVLGLVVMLSKQAYGALLFSFLLVPRRNFGNSRQYYWPYFFLQLFCSALLFLSWSSVVKKLYVPTIVGNDLQGQLAYVLQNPIGVLLIIAKHIVLNWRDFIVQVIGKLGWLDTFLPHWVITGYWIALFAATLLDSPQTLRVSTVQRAISAMVFSMGFMVIGFLIYVTGMPVGAQSLAGVQGRYLVPYVPFLLFMFKINNDQVTTLLRTKVMRMIILLIPAWAGIALMKSALIIFHRYYY